MYNYGEVVENGIGAFILLIILILLIVFLKTDNYREWVNNCVSNGNCKINQLLGGK